jgi:predicted DNA-binding transcriptional regulator AlpA
LLSGNVEKVMARLMTLRQIHDEKIGRGRSWIWQQIKEGKFPLPLCSRGGPALWDEREVDEFVARFIAETKSRAVSARRTEQALCARGRTGDRLVLQARPTEPGPRIKGRAT